MRTIVRCFLLFGLVGAVPRVAAAQAILAGEAKDTTGAVLPDIGRGKGIDRARYVERRFVAAPQAFMLLPSLGPRTWTTPAVSVLQK